MAGLSFGRHRLNASSSPLNLAIATLSFCTRSRAPGWSERGKLALEVPIAAPVLRRRLRPRRLGCAGTVPRRRGRPYPGPDLWRAAHSALRPYRPRELVERGRRICMP
eukprot:scaffold76622_cov26-Tisochrysis_lutea.AAC.3